MIMKNIIFNKNNNNFLIYASDKYYTNIVYSCLFINNNLCLKTGVEEF